MDATPHPPTHGVWEGRLLTLKVRMRCSHVTLPGPRQGQLSSLLRATRQDVTFERPEEYINHKTKGTIMTSSYT